MQSASRYDGAGMSDLHHATEIYVTAGEGDMPLAEALGQHSDAEVRDVRRGNGPFGPLPGPFQR